jgi:hypothetical protein
VSSYFLGVLEHVKKSGTIYSPPRYDIDDPEREIGRLGQSTIFSYILGALAILSLSRRRRLARK